MSQPQRRNRILDLGVLLLIQEILSVGYNTIPPVTLVTIIAQTLLYTEIISVPWNKWDVCISGKKVWNYKDYKTLVLSTIEHADDMHLYYNMISFLIKGRTLECLYGSANFALLLAILTLMTSGIYVALSVIATTMFNEPTFMTSCAIGFSGVIFALKFIAHTENPHGYSFIQGFQVPIRYAAWAELIAIHVLVPNASFIGHLAGILAGFLYIKTPLRYAVDAVLTSITDFPMIHEDETSSSSTHRESRQHSSSHWSGSSRYGPSSYWSGSSGYGGDRYNTGPSSYGWRI